MLRTDVGALWTASKSAEKMGKDMKARRSGIDHIKSIKNLGEMRKMGE